MHKYFLPVEIEATPETVFRIITNLEKIKIWEPSHKVPFISHVWSQSEGKLQVGCVLKVKSVTWTFVAKCGGITDNEVRWDFLDGPLQGTEFWSVKAKGVGCVAGKIMEYEVPKFYDKVAWALFGKKLHDWASLKQFKTIKKMAETNLTNKDRLCERSEPQSIRLLNKPGVACGVCI